MKYVNRHRQIIFNAAKLAAKWNLAILFAPLIFARCSYIVNSPYSVWSESSFLERVRNYPDFVFDVFTHIGLYFGTWPVSYTASLR